MASSLFTGELGACGVAIDAAHNKIYWGDNSGGGVRVGNLDGTGLASTPFADGDVCGVAVDPIAQKIYWTNQSLDLVRVGNLDGSGAALTLYAEPLGSTPSGLTIYPERGKIYWTDFSAGRVRVGDLNGVAAAGTLFVGELGPRGLAIDRASQRIYWTNFSGGQVRSASLAGGAASTLYSGENPVGISIDHANQSIYWANFSTGQIRRGKLGGLIPAVYIFIGEAQLDFSVLLQAPIGSYGIEIHGYSNVLEHDVPLSNAHNGEGEGRHEERPIRILSCTGGAFLADDIPAFLYRSPTLQIYSWFLDGAQIIGEHNMTFVPTIAGCYTCSFTGVNEAGAYTYISDSIEVSRRHHGE